MLIAHKIALNPNNKQATHFAQAAGIARLAYNWALAEWTRQYSAWKTDNNLSKPSQFSLRKQLNAIKRDQFPYMLDVSKCAPQLAIMQLGQAFNNFFAGRAKYPKFRKKGIHDRFSLSNDQFKVDGRRIKIPNLGWVKLREALRFDGKIMSATISRQANRWFVSIVVDCVSPTTQKISTPSTVHLSGENQATPDDGIVGIDLGIKDLATLSTGEKIDNPKALKRNLQQLQRLSRRLSRKVKGSNNRHKARQKLAKLHAKISHIRQDSLHKLTSSLATRFHTLVIEDLNIQGMLKNRKLSRAIADMGLFEFRRQLTYKAERHGGQIIVANRWFASSKICSNCQHKHDGLSLSDREWQCSQCHSQHDRDVNAAVNLKLYAASSAVFADGGEGSGQIGNNLTKPAPLK